MTEHREQAVERRRVRAAAAALGHKLTGFRWVEDFDMFAAECRTCAGVVWFYRSERSGSFLSGGDCLSDTCIGSSS